MSDYAATPAAFCSQCGRSFATEDLAQFGDSFVCAECKPAYVQRMREGGANAAPRVEWASIGKRFVALLIDGLVLSVASLAAYTSLGISFIPRGGAAGLGALGALVGASTMVNLGIGFAYYTVLLWKYGATLGKMAMGIKVVTAEGGPLSYGLAVGRYCCVTFLEPLTLGIGYLIAFFDDQKRTLHDRICGTRVIVAR